MAAFEKISSGIPEMDAELDHIRLGDNVVWQVDSIEDFRGLASSLAVQSLHDHRKMIYIQFSSKNPMIETEGVKVYHVELSHRFENFTVEIHHIIENEGKDAIYVFDCLSDLQVAWSADLMMSNFFKVTCPFLFQLDTVAYFPIIRGRHSFEAIAKIRETTQLFLDVYSDENVIYVHPLKVWNRYSPKMFLPHLYQPETKEFKPLTDGYSVSQFYNILNRSSSIASEQNADSWDRFFMEARVKYAAGEFPESFMKTMCRTIMTRDSKLRRMVEENFTAEDYFAIRDRMIGTGMIGGKSCGMLLARKLVENNLPELLPKMESHDSFFIGSDVFYTYIVQNNCWDLRIRQRTKEEYFSIAEEFRKALHYGKFPEDIRDQFRRMLDYFGQSPIIVRSSSILEDGFGNAFAGKYDSIFCVNTGSMEDRLEAFEAAARTVYASTMNKSALEYRLKRNLEGRDEQMALLVQRVSGSYFGNYFMPGAAGVGYSYSMYRLFETMSTDSAMLRMVMGLGTKAVDRTQGDYPKLVSLERPEAELYQSTEDRHTYSQHKIEMIDMAEGCMCEKNLRDIVDLIPKEVQKLLLEHDVDAEMMFRDRGIYKEIMFISLKGLCRKEAFIQLMQSILSLLQDKYNYPVDIEYTLNFGEDQNFVLNLLQCRPLQTGAEGEKVIIPEFGPEMIKKNALFCVKKGLMGRSRQFGADIVVYVDPHQYYTYPYQKKYDIAHCIGKINQYYKNKGKNLLLIVPGRIGTSSPELGVPVVFSNISEFCVICEVAYSKAGYQPELSFGSHMFQDLVETDMIYCAIMENQNTLAFHPERLKELENRLGILLPEEENLSEIIGVYDVSEKNMQFYYDMEQSICICM